MEAVGLLIGVCGVVALVGAMIWLTARGFKDGAFPDVILLVTGVSLIAYVVTRWDRAKFPVLVALGGFVATLAGAIVANTFSQERRAWQAFDQGVEAMEREDFDLAIKCFSEVISIVPDDPACFYNRGLAHMNKGRFDAAVADISEVIRLNPKDADAFAMRATAYRELGDEKSASQDEERAMQLGE